MKERQLQLPVMPPRIICNRCNAEKVDTKPCSVCGCPEFRLVANGGA
jgi:hypothetical protein